MEHYSSILSMLSLSLWGRCVKHLSQGLPRMLHMFLAPIPTLADGIGSWAREQSGIVMSTSVTPLDMCTFAMADDL